MKPNNPVHDFQASWRWPDDFEEWVASQCERATINVFAGLSPIGDVRLDLQTAQELNDAMEGAGQHVSNSTTIRANGFDTLPIADDTFDTTVADPPWKDITEQMRRRLFDELVRITKPAGRIIFNAWWIPNHQLVSLDEIRVRQDTDRYSQGTPSTSYAGIYTVHRTRIESESEIFSVPRGEFAPELSPTQYHYEATIESRDGLQEAVDNYDNRLLNPEQEGECPQCGNEVLLPIGPKVSPPSYGNDELYECPKCQFRAEYEEMFPEPKPAQQQLCS